MKNFFTAMVKAFGRMDTIEKIGASMMLIALLTILVITVSGIISGIKEYRAQAAIKRCNAKKVNRFKPDSDMDNLRDGLNSYTLLFVLAVLALVLLNNL